MGTWGCHPFDSDMALEWADSFAASPDAREVRVLLQAWIAGGGNRVEHVSHTGAGSADQVVLAACETITATFTGTEAYQSAQTTLLMPSEVHPTRPQLYMPQELAQWVSANLGFFDEDAVDLAEWALDILAKAETINEYGWSEPAERRAAIKDAQGRLAAAPIPHTPGEA